MTAAAVGAKRDAPYGTRRLSARRAVECTLALLLLAAAAAKWYALMRTGQWAESGLLRDQAQSVMIVVVQVELLLVVWLCTGVYDRARFVSSIGCFALFACVAGYEAAHRLPSCGCFGQVTVPPWATFVFDLCAVAALWFTRPRWSAKTAVAVPRCRVVWGLLALAGISCVLWGSVFARAQSAARTTQAPIEVLEPETWLGRPFPLFDDIPGSQPLRNGRWLVVLYHDDCESCQQAVPEYQALAISGAAKPKSPRVAFVAMPAESAGSPSLVEDSASYLRLALRSDREWFATTPVCVAMQDGKVIFSVEGEDAMHPPKEIRWQQ